MSQSVYAILAVVCGVMLIYAIVLNRMRRRKRLMSTRFAITFWSLAVACALIELFTARAEGLL